ncbi:hypothetical protein MPLA_930068 [Mesorhizobium sp. ORS 3359]|nr:hypothetical protein MPLA_930068 [Mesorhizobium sp. ORS 3359]
MAPDQFSSLALRDRVSVYDVLDLGVFALEGAGSGVSGSPVGAVSNSSHPKISASRINRLPA